MYHNVSRCASPSSTTPRASKIDLENIEELQDAWGKTYEMLRDPPPPPQLNSPRSLRACALGNVNPQYTLQKLSLKQHLFRVLGNASMLSALPRPSTTEYRVLMQSALRSFQEATIGLGTSQEKLAAFIAFTNQEELRRTQLASLRELRRQLVAEEVFEERKRYHSSGRNQEHSRHRPSSESRVSGRGGNTVTCCTSISTRSLAGASRSALWSSTMEENVRSRCGSVSSQTEISALNVSATGQLVSPASTSLSRARGNKAQSHHPPPLPVPSATPPSHRRTGAAEVSFTTLSGDAMDGTHGGPVDFTPTVSPSGKLPYTPRDVSSLNSSYFGNRSIQSTVSNPCGAPLPLCSANKSAVSPAPKRPVLAQKSTHQQPRRPLVPPPPQSPTQNSRKALSDSFSDAEHGIPLGISPQDTSGLESVRKKDPSTVSLNSNQLDILLNSAEVKQSVTSLKVAAEQQSDGGDHEAALEHTLELLHKSDDKKSITTTTIKATAVAAAPGIDSSATLSPMLFKAAASGNVPSTTNTSSVTAALTAAAAAHTEGCVSTPSSQSLTPRGRRGYTNHLNSPKQLVPNVFPRNKTPLPLSNASMSDLTPTPEDNIIVEAAVAAATVAPANADRTQRTEKALPPTRIKDAAKPAAALTQALYPPVISQAEQEDGFVYYCANPTRNVTKFYGGARFPIAGAVKL